MRHQLLGVTIMLLSIIGCAGAEHVNPSAAVTGEAFYRERIAVPPGTQLEVVLEDITRANAPAEVTGRMIAFDAGQPPYAFKIPYRPEQINASHRYGLRARLTHEGRLLFTTDQITPVITLGHPNEAKLLMKAPSRPRMESASGPLGAMPATFTGDLPCADCEAIHYHLDLFADQSFFLRMTYRGRPGGPFDDIGTWALSSDGKVLALQGGRQAPVRLTIEGSNALELMSPAGEAIVSDLNYALRRMTRFGPIEPQLTMRGTYSYMADAGIFTECLTGRKMPVAMEGDNRALEAAYLKARRTPGDRLQAAVEGRIVQRTPMEGPGPVATLLPVKFLNLLPGETCGPRYANAPLRDTYWKLTHLESAAVIRADNQPEAHIVLNSENRAAGSDGCNRFMGSYRLDGDGIVFSQLASTRMACPEGLAQEEQFNAALGAASRYRILGPILELFGGKDEMLARFEAGAPK